MEEEIPRPSEWAKKRCVVEHILDDWYELSNTREKIDGPMRNKIRQTIQAVRYNYREQELNAIR